MGNDDMQPIIVAMLRAIYQAAGQAAVVLLTALQMPGVSTEAAWILAGLAALGALGFRGIGEGTFDQFRRRVNGAVAVVPDEQAARDLQTEMAEYIVQQAELAGFDPNPVLAGLPGPLAFTAVSRETGPRVIGAPRSQ